MATLVAYGMPQKNIALRSASGAPLHKTLHFDSKNFTGKVRDDFEKALGVALQRFIGTEVPDVSQAKYLFTPDIRTLSMALASRRYNRVIYYGHALADGVTLAPLQRISAPQIAHALNGSGVATSTFWGATARRSVLCLRPLFLASPSERFAGSGSTTSRSIHRR